MTDLTDDVSTIGIWGPRARDIVASLTSDDGRKDPSEDESQDEAGGEAEKGDAESTDGAQRAGGAYGRGPA